MIRVKTALLKVLSDGEWHSASEMILRVRKLTGCTNSAASSAIHRLKFNGDIIKKEMDGSKTNALLYRIGEMPVGFGVSQNIAKFNELISAARSSHAAT